MPTTRKQTKGRGGGQQIFDFQHEMNGSYVSHDEQKCHSLLLRAPRYRRHFVGTETSITVQSGNKYVVPWWPADPKCRNAGPLCWEHVSAIKLKPKLGLGQNIALHVSSADRDNTSLIFASQPTPPLPASDKDVYI